MKTKDRVQLQTQGSYIGECLLNIWDKYRDVLISGASPLMAFIYHPGFHSGAQFSAFARWEKGDLHRFFPVEW